MTHTWRSLTASLATLLLTVTFAGNALANSGNWFDDKMKCIVPGAIAGAAVGAVVDGITVGGGTIGGAIIGALFCQPEEKAPAPVAKVDGDSDGDGVPDSKDKCPDTPKGTKVDHNGCPLIDKLELKGVWFAFNSDDINKESAAVLDEVAQIFKRYPTMVAEVGGHTCNIGSEKNNLKLSDRRANSVRNYLIKKGVDAKQLTAKGYGESQPAVSNDTPANRAKNRRTIMTITKQ